MVRNPVINANRLKPRLAEIASPCAGSKLWSFVFSFSSKSSKILNKVFFEFQLFKFTAVFASLLSWAVFSEHADGGN